MVSLPHYTYNRNSEKGYNQEQFLPFMNGLFPFVFDFLWCILGIDEMLLVSLCLDNKLMYQCREKWAKLIMLRKRLEIEHWYSKNEPDFSWSSVIALRAYMYTKSYCVYFQREKYLIKHCILFDLSQTSGQLMNRTEVIWRFINLQHILSLCGTCNTASYISSE